MNTESHNRIPSGKTAAAEFDAKDAMSDYRIQFILDDSEIYLDGNSLGPLLHGVKDRINHTVDHEWGRRLIRSWNESWIDLPRSVAAKVAPIIGAAAENVRFADSVSINLFKLMAASLIAAPEKTVILSVKDMFPTDLYIAEGLAQLLGPGRCELQLIEFDEISATLSETTNLLLLSQVNFRTGEAYDVAEMTNLAHQAGARVLWDLSHSAGVLPVNLELNQVDYAVGCGYKFLNGGPGAPAFVYVDPGLQKDLQQPLSGWMGHAAPFEFQPAYQPAPGMDQFLVGTPGILGMSAMDAALDLWQDISLDQVFGKSQALTAYFIQLVEQSEALGSLSVIKPASRGSQVSLTHEDAFAISQALIDAGIICDFRTPNIIRFGFAPLYTRFQDVVTTITRLEEILINAHYQNPKYQVAGKVT